MPDHQTLYSPLSAVIRRQPVVVPPTASIDQALRIMNEAKVGSLVVTDPESGRPLGIFTLRDLLKRVALASCDREQLITTVMSGARLVSLVGQATAYQAALAMAQHRLRHILVVDATGRLIGVVSQNDLYALQRVGISEISDEIREAMDIPALQHAAGEIRRLAGNMLAAGLGAETLSQFISTLNDILTLRVIELTLGEFELPEIDWCWIALGSEGRYEQTFSTDQDNGIIFDCPADSDSDADSEAEAESLRQRFLSFAMAVNRKLDACGFPLCRGNIMASNREWCLSLPEWRRQFSGWIHEAEPQALLNASIFFDFRPLHGSAELSEQLRNWLLGVTAANPLFLRRMAVNALQCNPPLGWIRDFVYDHAERFPHTIELKMYGSRPFVDAARILALANGVAHTGTAQRLRAAGEQLQMPGEDIAALVQAFYFIQLQRLRHQYDGGCDGENANRIDPAALNELDRQMLKQSFRQGKKLQQKLQLDYRL